MVKIERGAEKPIAEVAEDHWNLISPYIQAQERYHDYSLVMRVARKRDFYQDNGNAARAAFYSELLDTDCALLKEVILVRPEATPALIARMNALYAQHGLAHGSADQGSLGYEILHEVFDYENWRRSVKSKRLLTMLGVDVCPYCNMMPVWVHWDEERQLAIVSYDHFYNKATYPYLCLSFYNLIPACSPCNENFKQQRTFTPTTHFHPYLDHYDDGNTFDNDYANDATPYTITLDHTDERSPVFNFDLGIVNRVNLPNERRYAKLIHRASQRYPDSVKQEMIDLWRLADLNEVEQKICQEEEIPFKQSEILNRISGKMQRDFALKGRIFSRGNPLL